MLPERRVRNLMNDMSRMSTGRVTSMQRMLEAPEAFIEMLPLAVCICDDGGRILAFNRRAAALWGREPRCGDSSELFCGAHRLRSADGLLIARECAPVAEVLSSGLPVHGREMIVERPDGTYTRTTMHIDPVMDEAGALIGAVNCFHDVTEQRRDRAQVLDNERRLRDILEAIPVAVYTTDHEGKLTFYNRAAVEFSGREPEIGKDSWCVSWKLYEADGTPLPHDQCPMAVALREGRSIRGAEAIAERPDGVRVPFIPFPTPLHDHDGRMTGAINMLVDITDRKRAEERHKTMVDELNHRVKNTLATVQSLAAQTLRAPQVPGDVRGTFEARLFTLSRAHDHLTRAHWRGADIKAIAEDIFMPYRYLGTDRLRLKGEAVEVASHAAVTLSMIFHELAANALRYGALLGTSGHVDLTWHTTARSAEEVNGGQRLVITWIETGGPPVEKPLGKGFGSRLLENGVTQGLKGVTQIAFDPTGLRCIIDIPFPAIQGL
jgi:PAS domain S-box-containing protein